MDVKTGNINDIILNKTINELFEEQVTKTPNNIAIRFRNSEITYKCLYDKVKNLANTLRNNRIINNDIVGIVVKPSIEMLVGILAVLKAGGAYLPVDPGYPEERISYMLGYSNVKIILSQKSFEDKKYDCNILCIDDNELYNNDNTGIENISKPNDLAYVIYTSGSTGKPKGVMIEHKSLVNFFLGMTALIDFSEGRKILSLTTISFDIFVLETLLPLTCGLTVVLADENEQRNPKLISELIINNKIDMLQMTPSRMQLLFNHDKNLSYMQSLKEIMIGGEAFPKNLLDKIKSVTEAKIYNMYGPTETTVWSTVSDLTEKNDIDIGKPIINTEIYIVDENNKLVQEGAEGELCIGGKGLARGYLNRPDLTAEKFVINPFALGGKIYKTGDLARWLPNGNIQCLGRIDNQVKIRGHRIELEEIEAHLLKYESVKQVVAVAREGKENSKYLCAYFVAGTEILTSDLREYLSDILPDYMIPAYFVRVESLPQTPNGKIDRKALPDIETLMENTPCDYEGNPVADCSTIEQKIIEIIKGNTDIHMPTEQIDLYENLRDLGINSISFVKIIVTIETEFGLEFGDEDLDVNKFPTIKSLVEYVSSRQGEM